MSKKALQDSVMRQIDERTVALDGQLPAGMPEAIVGQYQYFTEARIERLRRAGYNADFIPLEAAVNRYVTGYLNLDDRYR